MGLRVGSVLARLIVMGAGALLASLPVIAAQGDSLEQSFAAPSTSVRPWVRWWWPGGAVQDAEIRREIDVLADAGFGGAEIQPFNTGITNLTPEERAAINDYATPSFFAHVRAAAEQSASRGLQIDYTFGSAWPSGGGFEVAEARLLPTFYGVMLSLAASCR